MLIITSNVCVCVCVCVYVCVLVAQSCLTLSDPMDCSPPGSSVRGIFQARILEWVTLLSRGSSPPGIEPRSPALQMDSLLSGLPGKLHRWEKTQSKLVWVIKWTLPAHVTKRHMVWGGFRHGCIQGSVSPVGGSHHPLAQLADILALFSISELWKKNCSDFKHNIFSFSSWKRRTMKYFLKLKKPI